MSRSPTHSDPDILGGTPVFSGTRVPVKNLWDYLEGGHSLEDFLEGFPGVGKEQAARVLERAAQRPAGGPEAERSPGKPGGAAVFRNTRIPVSAFFEHLKGGGSLDQFLESRPGSARGPLRAVLRQQARAAAKAPGAQESKSSPAAADG